MQLVESNGSEHSQLELNDLELNDLGSGHINSDHVESVDWIQEQVIVNAQ